MQIRKATLDDIIETTKLVEKYALENLPIVGLTAPYLRYFYTDSYRNQVKGIFLNGNEIKNKDDDKIFIVVATSGAIVGFVSGGSSLDNYDYDGEIYTIFVLTEDKDFEIRNLLFKAIIDELRKMECNSFHVEITIDDPNKDFYIYKGAKFITEIKNMTNPPYTTIDYGWSDINTPEL